MQALPPKGSCVVKTSLTLEAEVRGTRQMLLGSYLGWNCHLKPFSGPSTVVRASWLLSSAQQFPWGCCRSHVTDEVD